MNQNFALNGRTILNQSVSSEFVAKMERYLKEGIHCLGLKESDIHPVYCSTLNKHTCVVKNAEGSMDVVLDEHHYQVLSMMNLLFYMYGQNDIKFEFLRLVMTEVLKTPQKRVKTAAALLLAEQSVLRGNWTCARELMDIVQENRITEEDIKGQSGAFDFNMLLLRGRRTQFAQEIASMFYVFHELGHTMEESESPMFEWFRANVEAYMQSLQEKGVRWGSEMPSVREITCDVIALSLIFDHVGDEFGECRCQEVTEAYVSAVVNLSIMDSIRNSDGYDEQYYIGSWFRTIVALNATAMMGGDQMFMQDIQSAMNYTRMTYKNYRNEIMDTIFELREEKKNVQEKYGFFSPEREQEKEQVLVMIRAIE